MHMWPTDSGIKKYCVTQDEGSVLPLSGWAPRWKNLPAETQDREGEDRGPLLMAGMREESRQEMLGLQRDTEKYNRGQKATRVKCW